MFSDINPIIPKLFDYTVYVSSSGFLAPNPRKISNLFKSNFQKTLDVAGVNMSIKSSAVDDFDFVPMTIRGFLYECKLAIFSILNDFHVGKFNGGKVFHLMKESLSRPKEMHEFYQLGLEEGTFLFFLSKFFRIDGKMLNLRKIFLTTSKHFSYSFNSYIRGLLKGIKISEYALLEGKNEKWIFNKLKDL